MEKLTRQKSSIIFQARTRMLKVKNNYKGKHANLNCRACGQAIETQNHILNECQKIHTTEETKVKECHIFGEDCTELTIIAGKVTQIMTSLENLNE